MRCNGKEFFTMESMMIDTALPEYILTLTLAGMFFFVGWVMPRGTSLKRLQGKINKRFYNWVGAIMIKFHNFFADEEFYLEHIWQDTKEYVRKKHGYEKKKPKAPTKKK